MQFDLASDEIRSFAERHYRFTRLEGPMRLARFSDTSRGRKGRLGRFWMHAGDVGELLKQIGTGRQLIEQVSDRWAICDDWGDKGLLWVLSLPRGASIPAAVGKAHFQPVISMGTQARQADLSKWYNQSWSKQGRASAYWLPTDDSYAGGGLQYIVPVQTTDGWVDPSIESLIGPRIATDTVATNPDLFLASGRR